ncbi:MGMT family protein [Arthrobacter sp. HLT1-20]
MREQYVEAVLAVAELIPAGSVLSYGDIAALLESGGPRQVGAAMSVDGGAVPWWRVIRASGSAPQGHEARALGHYRQEGTALRGDLAGPQMPGRTPGWRVDMKTARWNPREADFLVIDAIAGRLHAEDQLPPAGKAPENRAPAQSAPMSEPRDGLGT